MTIDELRYRDHTVADRVAIGFGGILLLLRALTTDDQSTHGPPRDLDAVAFVILALACAALLFQRRPGVVALIVLGLTTWWYGMGYTSGLINVALLVAFFRLGATGDRRLQLAVGGFAVAFLLFSILLFSGEPWTSVIGAVGWTVAAMLAGEVVHARRLLLDEYARRAEQAEGERDAEAERRVAEERLRIARDLHDVLAHSVSLMTVQAGAAADAMDRRPEAARAALVNLRATGRDAMAEVGAMVAVLRQGSEPADTAPAPRLDGVPTLVAAARSTGIDVDLATDLSDGPLAGVVELTAFRVVQESLTNVVRHARADHAWVRLRREPDELVVEVRDDGTADMATTDGAGLVGMRERVESLGGRLSYGPSADGRGWSVLASLPVGNTTSAGSR